MVYVQPDISGLSLVQTYDSLHKCLDVAVGEPNYSGLGTVLHFQCQQKPENRAGTSNHLNLTNMCDMVIVFSAKHALHILNVFSCSAQEYSVSSGHPTPHILQEGSI